VRAAYYARRVLSVATGYAAGVWATHYTHLIPGYGRSVNGDDPAALVVAVLVAVVLWRVVTWAEHK
jgi:hypothetical protein